MYDEPPRPLIPFPCLVSMVQSPIVILCPCLSGLRDGGREGKAGKEGVQEHDKIMNEH